MAFSRNNALDQVLDIKGSLSWSSTRDLTDETFGYGAPLTGQTGAAASIAPGAIGTAVVTGLAGMTANSVGNFLTLSAAASAGNNSTFLIVKFTDANSVDIAHAAPVTDTSNGSIKWTERRAYCLNDDLDFGRTDRAAIKGDVFEAPIPAYQRPTATDVDVPANLANIAGMTLDARGFVFSRKRPGATVASTNTFITISDPSFKHSDVVNKSGVPCFDVPPYASDSSACFVQITNPVDGTEFEVQAPSLNAGNKVFGRTRAGSSISGTSVEIEFRSVPPGTDIATSSLPYTWQPELPTSVDLVFGYFEQLDKVSDSAFRTMQSLGVEESSSLRSDVTDIQSVIGMDDSDTFLDSLTNTSVGFFPFVGLTAAPTVTEALNVLNAQIGNRDYTSASGLLVDGESISASLQKLGAKIDTLSGDVAASGVTRVIERLTGDVTANTPHPLPAGLYIPDPTNNGLGMSVYTRGVLRDPGSVINGNDYSEDPGGASVTFYSALKAGDHINYYIFA